MGHYPLMICRTMQTPIGCLLLAATSQGLCRIVIGKDKACLVSKIPREFNFTWSTNHSQGFSVTLTPVINALEAYFNKASQVINVPLDLRRATPWQIAVWEALRAVPYGETRSYQWAAKSVSRPAAARAVGAACRLNPIPIIIPCHRIIRQDGQLGGYSGGENIKRKLLELEGYLN